MSKNKGKKESPKDLINRIVLEIERVAAVLNISPATLTMVKFFKHCNEDISEWDLRKIGGFGLILRNHFSETKDLGTIAEHKNHLKHVQKLEKLSGNLDSFYSKMTKDIATEIAAHPIHTITLSKYGTSKFLASFKHTKGGNNGPRSVNTIWSDHHLGTNISSNEVGGKNSFNWTISARRFGFLCDQIMSYKIEKRHLHEELVIYLNGDNIGGIIHNQEGTAYDLMIHQINGAVSYYTQGIAYLKQFFPKIRVVCQPGNHGRFMHKANKDRAMVQKYDGFENIIFYALSMIFKAEKNVEFNVSEAPFSSVVVQGNKVYMTHGDTVFNSGNVGKVVRMDALEQKINRINAEELKEGRDPYKLIVLGHVHHPLYTQVASGVGVIVNGSLVGLDMFALGIGIQTSNAAQVVWESTRKHVQGDVRFLMTDQGDNHAKYEKIIKPYNKELS